MWLAPVQAIVLPIADRHREYAKAVHEQLATAGLEPTWTSGRKRSVIRFAKPRCRKSRMLVVGDREAAEGTVGVRHRAGGDQGAQRAAQFIEAALGDAQPAVGPAAGRPAA